MGVAHHTHFLVWFELGRTELMRDLGCAYGRLEDDDGVLFPVIDVRATYHAPARYDDVLIVDTRLASVRGARVGFEYRITRSADGVVLATGTTEHAAVGRDGRPRRLPTDLRRRLGGDGDVRR